MSILTDAHGGLDASGTEAEFTSPPPSVPMLCDILSGVPHERRYVGTTCARAQSILPAVVDALLGLETTDAVVLHRLVKEKYPSNTCVFSALGWMATLFTPGCALLLVEVDRDEGVLGRVVHASAKGVNTVTVVEAAKLVVEKAVTTITFLNVGIFRVDVLDMDDHVTPRLADAVRNRAVVALAHGSSVVVAVGAPPVAPQPPSLDVDALGRRVMEAVMARMSPLEAPTPPLKRTIDALHDATSRLETRLKPPPGGARGVGKYLGQ